MDLFPWLLFAHILGAIIAFGPSFSMPIIGAMGGRERPHSNFAIRLSDRLAKVQILPLAILQGVTGVALMAVGRIDPVANLWLLVSIVLYLVALGFSLFVQTPAVRRIIELTTPPAGGPPTGGPPSGGPPAGGPPPELLALIRRTRLGGMFMTAMVVIIVFLMVMKPF
ncbi:MAG TPA: DUF2269 family protein [Candidatus Binatia bacterium]|nr:DUF2269 family protein [Candidatus Binatia bacterium]